VNWLLFASYAWPLLATSILGPLVGVAGVVVPYFSGRDQREHERKLARDDRLHDELRGAYQELLNWVSRMSSVVERTHPTIGPLPEPLPLPSDEEATRIAARVEVIGKDEVIAGMNETWRAFMHFGYAAGFLNQVAGRPSADADARKNVEEARQKFRDEQEALGEAIRSEIRA
jgi:hypothetical protein